MFTNVISTKCNLSTAFVGDLIQRDFIKWILCIEFNIVVFLISNKLNRASKLQGYIISLFTAYQQIKDRGIYFNRSIHSKF